MEDQEKNNQQEDKHQNLKNLLKEQKAKLSERINNLIKRMGNYEVDSSFDVEMMSLRQEFVDYIYDYKNRIHQLNYKNQVEYKNRFESYFQSNYKMQDKYKEKLVDSDVSDRNYKINLLSEQVDFFKNCIYTLDKTIYQIKNRVDLNKF